MSGVCAAGRMESPFTGRERLRRSGVRVREPQVCGFGHAEWEDPH